MQWKLKTKLIHKNCFHWSYLRGINLNVKAMKSPGRGLLWVDFMERQVLFLKSLSVWLQKCTLLLNLLEEDFPRFPSCLGVVNTIAALSEDELSTCLLMSNRCFVLQSPKLEQRMWLVRRWGQCRCICRYVCVCFLHPLPLLNWQLNENREKVTVFDMRLYHCLCYHFWDILRPIWRTFSLLVSIVFTSLSGWGWFIIINSNREKDKRDVSGNNLPFLTLMLQPHHWTYGCLTLLIIRWHCSRVMDHGLIRWTESLFTKRHFSHESS